MFIEEDQARCNALSASLVGLADVEVAVHQGEFEARIPEAVAFARTGERRFTFTFIDPCGWTGLGLAAITPLLQVEPGEVLINFMTNQINRFINDDQAKVVAQFEDP